MVGPSSGPMHLAQMCGTPIVCWGDNRKYNGHFLKDRYLKDWNPFNSQVEWIDCENWQPEPEEIVERIEMFV